MAKAKEDDTWQQNARRAGWQPRAEAAVEKATAPKGWMEGWWVGGWVGGWSVGWLVGIELQGIDAGKIGAANVALGGPI